MNFKFCPRCSEKLVKRDLKLFVCQQCGFHFHINPNPANAAILINPKREILLAQRKYPPRKDYWDLPGGFINIKETAEKSVMREIKEELSISLKNLIYFGSYPDRYYYQGINYYTLILVFISQIKNLTFIPSDDISQALFFSLDKIPYNKIAFRGIKQAIKDYLKGEAQ